MVRSGTYRVVPSTYHGSRFQMLAAICHWCHFYNSPIQTRNARRDHDAAGGGAPGAGLPPRKLSILYYKLVVQDLNASFSSSFENGMGAGPGYYGNNPTVWKPENLKLEVAAPGIQRLLQVTKCELERPPASESIAPTSGI